MTYTELGEAGTEERVETLLRVAADLTERSPKSRRRWRWGAALWIAALFPLVIGVERVSSRISARSHRPSRVAAGASDAAIQAATTSSEPATTTTATTSPSPSSSAVIVTAVARLDALVASTTVAPTAPATDVTTTVGPAPADTAAPSDAPAEEPPPEEAPPDTTRPPRRTPPRTTAPPAPATTAPAPTPAPATTPPPPPPTTPAPPTDPPTDPPTNPTNPPPPAFAVNPDAFTVPSSGGTVHPLANDSGVSASSLRVSGAPGDVSASTDGNGGIVVSASNSAQGAQRTVYYSVCDAGGTHCATARMTITFT